MQVKTRSDGAYTAEDDSAFEYLMDESDVAYWEGSNLPVIVVLVHLQRRVAYWKSTSEGTGPGRRRLRFTKRTDVFE